MNKRLDILNLEWPSSDRDLHMVIPILSCLKKKYTIKTKSIFNGYFYILLYKPKLLLISNFLGAGINLQITNLAYKSNIKVVSLVSEGNFDIEYLDQGLFGVSKNKVLNLDKYLLWSERTRKLAIKNILNSKTKFHFWSN